MASIDKINVNGDLYDIDLPTTATPSIASLTVGGSATLNGEVTIGGELSTAAGVTISKDLTVNGNLTVSGTSTLASVNCSALTCSGEGSIRYVTSQSLTATSVSANSMGVSGNLIVRGSSTFGGTKCSSLICPTLKASSSAGSLTVPTTSGTLARLQDFEPISEADINLLFI